MTVSTPTRRRLPSPPPPAPRPVVPAPWPVSPDPDEAMIARTAAALGLPEVLVAQWLLDAGELGRPLARHPRGARMG